LYDVDTRNYTAVKVIEEVVRPQHNYMKVKPSIDEVLERLNKPMQKAIPKLRSRVNTFSFNKVEPLKDTVFVTPKAPATSNLTPLKTSQSGINWQRHLQGNKSVPSTADLLANSQTQL
jgi:hypothetical protein